MTKYLVGISETFYQEFEIDVADDEKPFGVAQDLYLEGKICLSHDDPIDWTIEEVPE